LFRLDNHKKKEKKKAKISKQYQEKMNFKLIKKFLGRKFLPKYF